MTARVELLIYQRVSPYHEVFQHRPRSSPQHTLGPQLIPGIQDQRLQLHLARKIRRWKSMATNIHWLWGMTNDIYLLVHVYITNWKITINGKIHELNHHVQ